MSANVNVNRTHVHQLHPAEKPGILVKAGAEPVLKATNVTKWFGENHVLRGASITVWPGETVCILGRSGSGKSTFLRSLNFLEDPTDGTVEIDGVIVGADPFHKEGSERQDRIREVRMRAGMVFQEFNLFPHLTVLENVALAPRVALGLTPAAAERRAKELLKSLGLAEKAREYPDKLSGGQQQRVALARALAPKPELLLLDEPFSNLDVDLRERLALEIRNILKAANATALFVTHDQMEAFAIGDVIGVIQEGHLHQWDDAYHLYHRPASRFVAEFIGHGVFIPGVRSQSHGHLHVQTVLGDLTDPHESADSDGEEAKHCDVLLRADDIVHDDEAMVKAEILRKSFRGSEFLYTLRLRTGETVMAHVPSHHDHTIGEWIGIRAEVDHVVTFERQT